MTAEVYRYWINTHPVAVKCFTAKDAAEREKNILEKIMTVAW